MQPNQLTTYRRRLPHWRLENAIYFVTWRLAKGQIALVDAERESVASAPRHFHPERYWLHAYVVMNDHDHVLVQPEESRVLQDIVHSWKSYTAHEILQATQRPSPLWQNEYFDRIVRNEKEKKEKTSYILANPQKRWPGAADYPWMGCFWQEISG